MTTFPVTAPVRKWPCLTPSLTSVHILVLTSHWTLQFIMPACLQARRKHFSKPLWLMQRCVPLLTSSSLVGQMTSRRFLIPYVLTGNIVRPSLLKMALSSVEKPLLFLLQKGREYYTNYTSSIKESPNPSCSCMWMYLLALYKQSHWRSCLSMCNLHLVPSQECCNTSHSYTNSVPPMADMSLRHLYTGRSQLHHMWWLLLKNDPHLMHFPSGQGNTTKSPHCSRKCSQSMESQKSFTLIMVLNMLVSSLLIFAPLGVSPFRPQALTIHNQMDLQSHV